MVKRLLAVACAICFLFGSTSLAAVAPETARDLYSKVSPSLVAVQYTWESEAGRRELIGAGVAVTEDGLIMVPMELTDLRIPDEQMKDFKVVIPSQEGDPDEVPAAFQGRDERTNVAFVKADESGGAKAKSASS